MSTLIDAVACLPPTVNNIPELIAALKDQAPEVLEWLAARHETIVLAERFKATPPPAPPPKRKRKLTEEQIRERKEYHIKRAARDSIAQKAAVLNMANEFDELLKQHHLDDDHREQLVRELVDELLAKDEGEGKKLE